MAERLIYNQKIKIPVRIVETKDMTKKKNRRKFMMTDLSKRVFKATYCSALVSSLIIAQSVLFSGFEAHIINVTARICNYSETRTMGYWKNHPNVYLPYLSQYLGAPGQDEEIATQDAVTQVFLDYNLSMRNKLRGQLLAMKFNIVHYGIGGYAPEGGTRTLDDIVTEADTLLRDPEASNSALEVMKTLLDDLNNLHQIRFCSAFSGSESSASASAIVDVVINEFLPNPVGRDNAPMPNGEWIELYNKGNEIDVAGWVLYDTNDNHALPIASNNTNTHSTIIGTGEFLVVYRDGNNNFALNNVGGDTIRLYNGEIGGGATLIDSHTYIANALEGKSFARIPDGSDNWVDPIPTPGESNAIGEENIVFGPALPEEGEETNVEIINEVSQSEIIEESTGQLISSEEQSIPEENIEQQEQPAAEEPVVTEEVTEETDDETQAIEESTPLSAEEQIPENENSTEENTENTENPENPAEESFNSGEENPAVPPEETIIPPEENNVPPAEENIIPAEENNVPPEENSSPPEENSVPPEENNIPAEEPL